MGKLRRATNRDWIAVHGNRVAVPGQWVGLAVDGRRCLEGLGGMFVAQDDQWWAFFWRAPHVRRPMSTHKAGRIIVETAREAGVQLNVLRDDSICSSKAWLTRLGFVHVEGDQWQTR
jgi:hypothetical protein